jgi:hypothetical protein
MTGIVRITAITNGHFATAMVLSPLASTTETKQWAEGSWSDINGYPAAVTFFNDRIIYGGTKKQPQVVWFSASDDFSNFFSGVIADQSFAVQIMATDDIVWLDALDVVCVGTSGGEWIITSNQLGNPITPDPAPTIRQIAAYGSNAVMPTRVANAVLFTDHMGRKVREFAFDQQRQSYEAPDLTVWAEHITTSGIVSMALQRNPDEILWACRADGTLLSMTYDRAQNIVAWARHPMVWAETYDPAAAATTSAYDAAVLADDLVAYWKLTESSGSVADSSGNSHGGYYQATGSTYPYSGNKPATVTLSFTNTPSGDWAGIASPMSLSFSGASWHWTDGFGLSIHLSWDPTSLPPALWRLEFRDIGIGSDYYAGVVAGGNFPFGQYVGSGQFTDVAITP